MTSLRVLGVAVAASVTTLLSACAGSDGGSPELLLVSSRDGDYAIYGMRADGGSQERLSEEMGNPASPRGLFFQTEPAWSPDGSRIAFASKREGSFDIYSMAADGSDTQRLTTAAVDESDPSWSPSGQLIVFSRGTAGDLYVMNADGTNARPIVTGDARDTQPAWSPDGRWIAYVRQTPGTSIREVWRVRPNGTGARPLTSLGVVSDSPAWSPDSTRIAFASNDIDRQYDIYSVGVDGGDQQRLTVTENDSFEPAWSPDGETIAFSESGSIYAKSVAADPTADAEALTDPEGNDSAPAWKPALPAD